MVVEAGVIFKPSPLRPQSWARETWTVVAPLGTSMQPFYLVCAAAALGETDFSRMPLVHVPERAGGVLSPFLA